ncbi:MAG: 3-hydroxyacyl-ACP dehydratase FabZ [Rickettsiaceae bacterium]|nr:3-hydroxyacyl-ACP dehydratase FabZ [Rickettsiaceae bacterium]
MNDIKEIMSIIPHRYPFLLVDKVISFDPGKTITCIKNVTFNEPHFIGHFPDNPIMPGVLIIEAMAQSAAILVAKSIGAINKNILFLSIDNAKFRKIVVPGDSLKIVIEVTHNRADIWKCKAKSFVEDAIVAESIFTAMIQHK